nr:hypothetical protein [Bacteroidales bacterium]
LSDYKIKQVIILKPNPPAFAHSAKLHEQKQGDKFINNVVKLYIYKLNAELRQKVSCCNFFFN